MIKNILLSILILTFLAPIIWLFSDLSFSEEFNCKASPNPIPLTKKNAIEQFFAPTNDNLSALEINFVTYARSASGEILFQIYDNSKNEILSKRITASSLKDNSFYRLKTPLDLIKKDSIYSIKISSSKPGDKPAGLKTTASDCYFGKLQKNNKEMLDADIIMHLKYSKNNVFLNIKHVIKSISNFKPFFLKEIGLVTIFLSYIMLISLTIVVFFRKIF